MFQLNNQMLGLIWMLVFCLASTIADGMIRYITIDGLPSSQVLFIRCFLGALILLPFVLRNKTFFISKNILKLYFYRGILAFLGAASWFYFLKYVDFTALVAVGFTTPLFTALLAMLFLGERFSVTKMVALLIGFSGAMVVVRPFDIDFNIYLLFAVGSSFVWAISLIFAKKLSSSQPPMTIAFYFATIITPFALILALPVWQWPTPIQWNYLMLFIGFATVGQFAIAKAFSYAELMFLMPVGYSELIFAAIFSYIVFGDIATLNTWLGGAIILGSAYIIVRTERKHKQKMKPYDILPER